MSKIIAAKLISPPLALNNITVGELANTPAKKILANKIISASTSVSRYSATNVTTFAKPNFAPGGSRSGGNNPSTKNKISDAEIKIASAVSRRKSITNLLLKI